MDPIIAAILTAALVLVTTLYTARLVVLARRKRDRQRARVHAGDYVASNGRLYCIEHVRGNRVLIEDCRSGDLFDADAAEIRTLRTVRSGAPQA